MGTQDKVFNKEDDVIAQFEETNKKLYDSAWKAVKKIEKFYRHESGKLCREIESQ